MNFKQCIKAAVVAVIVHASICAAQAASPFDWLQQSVQTIKATVNRPNGDWAKQPPKVDDERGIGWKRGAIIGVTRSTDFTEAVEADFTVLTSAPGDRLIELDMPRLLKLNGDSDVYAYWLATSQPFSVLVDAFRRAFASSAPANGPGPAIDEASSDQLRANVTQPWSACSTELQNRINMDRQYLAQTFGCERHELRNRKRIAQQEGRTLQAMAEMAGMLMAAPDGCGSGQCIPQAYRFTNGKRRIAYAYGVLAQAGSLAANNKLSTNVSGILWEVRQMHHVAMDLASQAAEKSGRAAIYRPLASSNPWPNSIPESMTIARVAVEGGSQRLDDEVTAVLRGQGLLD